MEREDGKNKRREEGGEGEANTWNPDWNIRGAEALDWNVRGRSGPGLERPGLRKEEETVAESSGEEHMNRSKDQMRKDTTNESREAGGEGAEGRAAKTDGTQTGTTGEAAHQDWNIRGRSGLGLERLGLQGEEEAAAARSAKESKNKSQERGRKKARRTRGGKREEKEKNERRMSTWNPDRNGLERPG